MLKSNAFMILELLLRLLFLLLERRRTLIKRLIVNWTGWHNYKIAGQPMSVRCESFKQSSFVSQL